MFKMRDMSNKNEILHESCGKGREERKKHALASLATQDNDEDKYHMIVLNDVESIYDDYKNKDVL